MDGGTATVYRRWAQTEVHGVSATYFEWASSIADDAAVLALISSLPRAKRQPNLVFAAARWVGAPVGAYPPLRAWLLSRWADVAPVIMARSTQTNESGRCAVLLPVLSRLPGPLALIEAGASAGLCLYPDRYSYRYRTGAEITDVHPASGPSPVVLPCVIHGENSPSGVPDVVWRRGIDLSPVDVRSPESLRWLETLIWPEHDDRRARLHAAASLVASDPPEVVEGDLLETVPELIAQAPSDARVVVFHSAVLAYLSREDRQLFADAMRAHPDVTWISNEGADVFPDITRRVSEPDPRCFILAVDGDPVALTGPHGQSYRALAPAPAGGRTAL